MLNLEVKMSQTIWDSDVAFLTESNDSTYKKIGD